MTDQRINLVDACIALSMAWFKQRQLGGHPQADVEGN